jgi:oligoribonuclease (3'-5' exoribonuclease)
VSSDRWILWLDLETTGLHPAADEIIEVAAVLTDSNLYVEWDGNAKVDSWAERIQFSGAISEEASLINGYKPEDWKSAVSIERFWDWVDEVQKKHCRGEKLVIAGHNPEFDKAFLERALSISGRVSPFRHHVIDTVTVAALMRAAGMLKTESLSLLAVRRAMGDQGYKPHRAKEDVIASMQIFNYARYLMKSPLALKGGK